MKTITTNATILGKKNLGESDKLVFLYTEELGKLKIVAKGARKICSKFTGHLETLNFCKVSLYFGPKNTILTEISTEKTFFRKRKSLQTLTNAIKIAEITNNLLYENQKFDNLSALLKETLKYLSKSHKKDLITTSYKIKILDKSGTIPDFREIKIPIEKKYIKFFNFIKDNPYDKIEKIKLTKEEKEFIKSFTEDLIKYNLN